MKIRTRIILGFALIVGVSFYFLLRDFTEQVERQYLQAVEEPMVDFSNLLATILESQGNGSLDTGVFEQSLPNASGRKVEARIYDFLKTTVSTRVYVTDQEGRVVFDSEKPGALGEDYSRFNDVYLTLRGKYGARSTRTDEADEGSSIMYVAAPVKAGDDIIGVVSVGKPQRSMADFIFDTRRTIQIIGLATAAGAILAGAGFSFWLTRPIRRLTDYARAVKRGDRVTLPRLGRSEIGTLGLAFEEMRDALEGKNYVEHYVQTLTHEMKSPIAAIRGASDLLTEEMSPERRMSFVENIRKETERLQNIIDRLLHLAALEGRKQLHDVEPVDLDTLVAEVIRNLSPQALAHGVRLVHRELGQATVKGERFLIETAVANLLQNAIEFSPHGGEVAVSVKRGVASVRVEVEDSGPGIPDYARERVFERFYSLPRPSSGRKSSGLGLCLVREIAELHGGTISIQPRETGGTLAVLTLQG